MSSLNSGSPTRRNASSYSSRRSESDAIGGILIAAPARTYPAAAVLRRLDSRLLYTMRTRFHGRAGETVAKWLGRIGEYGAVWLLIGIVLAFVDPDNGEDWVLAGLLGPVAIGLNFAVKLIVRRPRPVLEGLPPLGGAPSSLSFPSAHATSSFAVATSMTRVDELGALAFMIAVTLSLGRPYLGMHYPSDVLVGAGLGVLLGLLVPVSL